MINFIFDLDGTIVEKGQPIIEPLAHELINMSNNHTVIFASARPVRDMLPLIPSELHQCTMIGCNGGMAWQGDTCLFSHSFDNHVIVEILALLKENNTPYVLDGNWAFSCSDVSQDFDTGNGSGFDTDIAKPSRTNTHEFHDYIRSLSNEETSEHDILTNGVTKILILDSTKRDIIEQYTQPKGLCINYHRHDDLFDITPDNENKYDTLKLLGINFENSIAFGNDSNDFKMLENAQYAVFLGNKDDFANANVYVDMSNMPMLLKNITDALITQDINYLRTC